MLLRERRSTFWLEAGALIKKTSPRAPEPASLFQHVATLIRRLGFVTERSLANFV